MLASQEVNEFEQFSLSYPQPGLVTSVTASEYVPGSNFSFDGKDTLVYGKCDDVFVRKLSYVDLDYKMFTVGRFADLPEIYGALYSYIPPSVQFKFITITTNYIEDVTLIPKATTDELVIRYNYGVSNSNLTSAVAKGKY